MEFTRSTTVSIIAICVGREEPICIIIISVWEQGDEENDFRGKSLFLQTKIETIFYFVFQKMENKISEKCIETDPAAVSTEKGSSIKDKAWLRDTLSLYIESILALDIDCQNTGINIDNAKVFFSCFGTSQDMKSYRIIDMFAIIRIIDMLAIITTLREFLIHTELTESQHALLYLAVCTMPNTKLFQQILQFYLCGKFRFTMENLLWVKTTLQMNEPFLWVHRTSA